jgi:hypothetical protein
MTTRTTTEWPKIDAIHYKGIYTGTPDRFELGKIERETSNGYEEAPGRWIAATHKMLPVKFRLHPDYEAVESASGEPRIYERGPKSSASGYSLREAMLIHIAVQE